MERAITPTDDTSLRATCGPADTLMSGCCLAELGRRSAGLLPRAARTYMCPADLVQDILLTTWRRAPRLHPDQEDGLQRYLQRALTNRARTESRRVRRRTLHDRHFLTAAEPWTPSPLDGALATERERAVRIALSRLRPRDRQLVIGRHVLDWPWSQVAAVFGFDSPDSARVAGTRARQRLARHLAAAG